MELPPIIIPKNTSNIPNTIIAELYCFFEELFIPHGEESLIFNQVVKSEDSLEWLNSMDEAL